MNVLGTWTSKGLPRPSWSNARGDVRTLSQLKIPFFFCFINVPVMRRPLETTVPPPQGICTLPVHIIPSLADLKTWSNGNVELSHYTFSDLSRGRHLQ